VFGENTSQFGCATFSVVYCSREMVGRQQRLLTFRQSWSGGLCCGAESGSGAGVSDVRQRNASLEPRARRSKKQHLLTVLAEYAISGLCGVVNVILCLFGTCSNRLFEPC